MDPFPYGFKNLNERLMVHRSRLYDIVFFAFFLKNTKEIVELNF